MLYPVREILMVTNLHIIPASWRSLFEMKIKQLRCNLSLWYWPSPCEPCIFDLRGSLPVLKLPFGSKTNLIWFERPPNSICWHLVICTQKYNLGLEKHLFAFSGLRFPIYFIMPVLLTTPSKTETQRYENKLSLTVTKVLTPCRHFLFALQLFWCAGQLLMTCSRTASMTVVFSRHFLTQASTFQGGYIRFCVLWDPVLRWAIWQSSISLNARISVGAFRGRNIDLGLQ